MGHLSLLKPHDAIVSVPKSDRIMKQWKITIGEIAVMLGKQKFALILTSAFQNFLIL